MNLDEKDQALITLLKANSRRPVIELAKQLGVSRSTVQNRIETLQRRGIIKSFTIEFDAEYERKLLKAQMLVNLTPGVSRHVIKLLQQRPQITSIMSVSGVYDLILELTVEASSQLDELVDDIRETKGVEKTVTCVVLSNY
ncbi:MAG: Lrp/AsnC family transcriptional regulator [Paraglaciecola sp.]|uniref:Lrp/AsnC family transcriptional regulator n=1 Tax=Paraglaciecola sp. TaxID=1920173 RepID=UPI0032654155